MDSITVNKDKNKMAMQKIEENNRMGKTRDLFKKIRDTNGNFSCKDGLNKGQKWYEHSRSRRY